MGRLKIIVAAILAALVSPLPAVAQRSDPPAEQRIRPLPRSMTQNRLERFSGDRELRAYINAVKRESRARGEWWSARLDRRVQVAQLQDAPCEKPEDCPGNGEITVTAAKVSKPNVTNVQEAGVDEGDIVKQIGPWLIVLQDGRLFSIDTRKGDLALADRIDVYRTPTSDTWYDEMLVQGNHIVVTGYSYDAEASEFAVLKLGPDGKLSREGSFLLSSSDYYSGSNYATRLVGDSLVVYAPYPLSQIDNDNPFWWPRLRRWEDKPAEDEGERSKRRIIDARSIFKPILPTLDPTIHTVSICPLGPVGRGKDLKCKSTAVMGPARREFYVTPEDAYLWVYPGDVDYDPESWSNRCDRWSRRAAAEAHSAALYRVPLSGEDPTAVYVQGVPYDQFSIQAKGGRLDALVSWDPIICQTSEQPFREDEEPASETPRFVSISIDRFDAVPAATPRSAYTMLPTLQSRLIENRFTETNLVYSGRDGWGRRPPDDDRVAKGPVTSRAVVVPIRAPGKALPVDVPHDVVRLERLGEDVVMTGYSDQTGLKVSVLNLLGTRPTLSPPVLLKDRFESEGRSHAFNTNVDERGNGQFGLPTVKRGDDNDWYWRSDPSDVSFFDRHGARTSRLGELIASPRDTAVAPGYSCEVSCIDWYGNTRPIFTDGRTFALSATELIEGRVIDGKIVETRRLNLTTPIGRPRERPSAEKE